MQSVTIRIDSETHARLQRLASAENRPMTAVLSRILTEYERRTFLENANAAYARLRADPKAWKEELAERALWDRTSLDGLEGE